MWTPKRYLRLATNQIGYIYGHLRVCVLIFVSRQKKIAFPEHG